MNKTKAETRKEFREMIEKKVHFSNGFWYYGDYVPGAMTGRYSTKEAAIQYQLNMWDIENEGGPIEARQNLQARIAAALHGL